MNSEPSNEVKKVLGYVSVPAVVVLVGLMFIGGYCVAWNIYSHPGSTANGVAFVAALIMAIGIRWPIKFWIEWMRGREGEFQRLAMQQERKAMQEQRERDAQREQPKRKGKGDFDQNDFDATARSILLKAVIQSRKKRTPVSGGGLVEVVMKSIH